MATKPQYNFTINRQDLDFILKQIKIAEGGNVIDAAGQSQINPATLASNIGGVGAQISSVAILPYGLRTVDGTWNHILPNDPGKDGILGTADDIISSRVGAADFIMPRITPVAGVDGIRGTADDLLHTAEVQPANFFGPGPAGTVPTSYAQTAIGNIVFDSQPRIISNLIVDQTANNPAAVAADAVRDGIFGDRLPVANIPGPGVPTGTNFSIPNLSPDIGLSPPFNGWMTFFGQFFDHGLDLIDKSGGTIFIPLQPDDPLFVPGGNSNFMVLTRAANTPGPDGILGTADDVHDQRNTTTPFVDQNQTYTSHPSHQVFLREYAKVADGPDAGIALDTVATGHVLNGAHGEGNWGEVKAQALNMLGIRLSDADVTDCPLLATDRYGKFIPGPTGFAQVVTTAGLRSATVDLAGVVTPVDLAALGNTVVRTGHAFLNDIAHSAAPKFLAGVLNPDTDLVAGGSLSPTVPAGSYDNELLDRHFATGDGRGNENIGLTTVHSVFHSEHNRLVQDYKQTIIGSGDLTFTNDWMRTPLAGANLASFNALPVAAGLARDSAIDTLVRSLDATNAWDGERMFQAGRFVTEMQYQHLVFEEFARAVQPQVDPFVFSNSPDLNPAITAEFANVVYRFGHSMLNETVARMDNNLVSTDIGLIQAFLNPLEFDAGLTNVDPAVNEHNAIGNLVRGMARQVGQEIDEFVVEALRNNLVGLPLDLATLNMTRARDTGMPSFNEARAQFFAITGDAALKPYTSWVDLAVHLKNPSSVINFIAAYGQHSSILAEATTDGKRAAATALVMGVPFSGAIDTTSVQGSGAVRTFAVPVDRLDFLNSTGATWTAATSGLNKIDFWIGGLAEQKLEFGGMLGPTFNYVFESQMEHLQNGDRFYYLSRTQGTNMLNQLEPNTFASLVMRNSNLGDADNPLTPAVNEAGTHVAGLLFQTPNYILEMDPTRQNNTGPGPDGILFDDPATLLVNEAADNTTGTMDPVGSDPILNALFPLVRRVAPGADVDGDGAADGGVLQYNNGPDHLVLGGTAGNDTLGGGRGVDTLWGDGGNDILDGGDEADQVFGGNGDDIITDHGTPAGAADFLRGNEGDDVIDSGTGNDILFGGAGQDFIIVGPDFQEVFAGEGNDFILGGQGPDALLGNEGDDWIEGGEGLDGISGENSELFFNSPIIGNDVLNGQGNDTDYDGESGDDIMVEGPGIQRNNGMLGFDWGIHKGDPVPATSDLGIPFFPAQTVFTLRDRFDSVEGLSGWNLDDQLTGVSFPVGAVGAGVGIIGAPATDSKLLSQNVSLISGLAELLGTTPAAVALLPKDTTVFDPSNGGDIILGGGGSDIINGKAGNDMMDGNAWLNVRIAFAKDATAIHGSTIGLPFATDAQGRYTVDSMNELRPFMLSGKIDPGGLQIVREIVTAPIVAGELDVALFAGAGGVFVNNVGAPSTTLGVGVGSTLTGVGFTITRTTAGAGGIVTVVDTDTGTLPSVLGVPVGDPLLRNEGTDTLRNFEIARFTNTDGTFTDITLNGVSVNSPPVGLPAISDITPTQGQTLTASTAGITDANGLGAFSFQWQTLVGGTTWTNVQAVAPVVGTNPTLVLLDILSEPLVGQPLRVVASYTDGGGTLETVTSAATDGLGNQFTSLALLAPVTINGTAFADDLRGNPIIGVAETLNGLGGDDILTGNGGADILNGGLGNDLMFGNGGADQLTGGAGLDTMSGGAGSDTFFFLATTDTGNALGARDIITDFTSGADRINLAGIDANTLLAGDQAFVPTALGGTGAFTGVAGQVRGFFEGANIIIEGDTNGDGISDFQIQLNAALTIVPADFVL